jgi:hypothetical protein
MGGESISINPDSLTVEGEIAYQTRHDLKENEAMMKIDWPRHFSFSVPVGSVSSNGEQKRT